MAPQRPLQAEANEAMRRPLAIFAIVVPLGLLAEIYRWLSEAKATPLAERHWAELGSAYGIHGGLPLVLVLGLTCIGMHLHRRDPWDLPDGWLCAQILLWALLWTTVRTAVAITVEAMAGQHNPLHGMARLDALAQLGYCFAGALQEETIYRGLLLGLGSALLARCGQTGQWLRWLLLLPAVSVLFALVHTSVLNPTELAEPFTWPGLTRHLLGGLLYGIIFLRQGLAVAVLAHFGYNCVLMFGMPG